MASAQWLLNDTSVASNAYWTAESGSSYKLKNVSGSTRSRITSSPSPYEGSGCYRIVTNANDTYQLFDSSNNAITGGTYYFDTYVYTRSSPVDEIQVLVTGEDFFAEYSWVLVQSDGKLLIKTYDPVNSVLERTASSAGACPDDEWFRVQVKATAAGITETKLFKGTGINGTTADTTLTFSAAYNSFNRLYGGNNNGVNGAAVDDIKFDNTAYPTRSTAHTAAGTATGTATGTAAMSNAGTLQATATGTATGTAAASNQRVLDGSATGTATGTATANVTSLITVDASATVTASGAASMASTQIIGGSGTGTATGTTSASVAGVVTISGSATITGTGTSTASVAMAQTATATGTVVATSSVDFIVIPPITLQSDGTVVAEGSAAMGKTMQLEATATATATSDAGMTHTFYIFKPPTREISPLSLDPYYQLVGYFQGRTLVKRDGVWKLVQNRQEDWLDQCEYVFKGGRENRINGTEKTELESAGYTVETRTS